MKLFSAVILCGVIAAATPVYAQDTAPHDMADHAKPMPHHNRHKPMYKRDYKTDQAEIKETEDLNKQYRGVPKSDLH